MTHPHVQKALQYAKGVVSGEILACKWVRLACQRHLSDLERADGGWTYRFDPAAAERVCGFVERFPHVKGRWAVAKRGHPGSNLLRLEPWQCFVLCVLYGWVHAEPNESGKHLRRFRFAYIAIPRKNAKALAQDTEIPTPFGFVPIADIHPGDTVFGGDGRPCRVVAESEVFHDHDCYEVEFSTGEVIVADAGHLWVTDARSDRDRLKGVGGKTDGPKPSVKTTREIAETLLVRGERNHRVAVAGPVDGVDCDLPAPPYTLGAWLGDGHSACSRITGMDAEVWDGVAADGYEMGGVFQRGAAETRTIYGLSTDLRAAGVLGAKVIPDKYFFASIEQRRRLLAGLMDTDGSISRAGQCTFTTTSEQLAADVKVLVASLGLKPSVFAGPAVLNGRNVGTAYRVQFWAYRDTPVFRIERKRIRHKPAPKRRTRTAYRQIVDVRPVSSVPTKCIAVDSPDQTFLAGRSFIPTHNSTTVAPLGLYHLAADGEPGAEVFCGATSKDQAFEVFRPARQMALADSSAGFRGNLGVEVAAESIFRPGDGSFFKPLIGKPGDGSSPSCYICDEYHEHPDDTQLDTMRTGMGAREQPLAIVITTAGEDVASPCHLLQQDVQKILEGTITDGAAEETFAIIWTIDEGDDWTSDDALIKANPNYGVSVFPEQLKSLRDEALRSPRKQNVFKTKRLNVWVHARDPWMNMELWNRGADAPPEEEFAGARCWTAMDLSSKIDLTAVVRLYRRTVDGVAHYYAYATHYLPEARAQVPECQHYQGWILDGHLKATDGDAIDYGAVQEDVLADAARMEMACLAFDPWNAMATAQAFQAEGLPVVEVPQNVRHLSEPMKEMEALVMAGRFHHTGDPVLTWAVSNVTAKEDAKGNLFPRKESREAKIDPAVALITAMSRAMLDTAEPKRSVYETRGVRVL